jgi:hypothetical protein
MCHNHDVLGSKVGIKSKVGKENQETTKNYNFLFYL